MNRMAVLSSDRLYRYSLGRVWEARKGLVAWVMLNPSTADARDDDATIRRCIGFTKLWGYGGLYVVNLYAYRATDPKLLRRLSEAYAVGPRNDDTLKTVCTNANVKKVIAAWGAHGAVGNRPAVVMAWLRASSIPVYCLGRTNAGDPRHPVRLPYTQALEAYDG